MKPYFTVQTIASGAIIFRGIVHIILSSFVILFVADYFSLGDSWAVFAVAGSLLPDIDHPKSTIGRFNPFAYFLMTHRGHCHSILGCFIMTAPFMIANFSVGSALFVGALLHLAEDKISSGGQFHIKWW